MPKFYNSRNYVNRNFAKECRDCGAAISFAKNQAGKWLCVDVQTERTKNSDSFYWERSGANNNFINTHVCSGALRTRLIFQACQTHSKINQCFTNLLFKAVREQNFQDENLARYQLAVQLAHKRIERRVKAISPKFIANSLSLQDALRACGVSYAP